MSVGPGGADALGGGSLSPALSDDGRYVVFDSAATNLVANDTNGRRDVFIFDRQLGQTERVSVATGGVEANHHSIAGAVSADGSFVVFLSVATNLVANDSNNQGDVFVRDRQAGTTERVNVGPGGVEASGYSGWMGVDGGSWPDYGTSILTYELQIADNTETSISADGRHVAFVSTATNLVADDTNYLPDVFVHDRQTGVTTRVNLTDAGTQVVHTSAAPGLSRPHVSMSADGRYVAFSTNYAAVSTDTNNTSDVYVRDRQTNQTTRVSVHSDGSQSNGYSGWPSISGDGRFVAFASDASNLVAGADNQRDVYRHDRQTGQTSRVSVNTTPGFKDRALAPAISRDGRWVAYTLPLGRQAFLYDAHTGALHLVSRATASSPASAVVLGAAVNADGSVIAFASPAGNLVASDTNGADDIFVATSNLIYNGGFGGGDNYWQFFQAPGGIIWSVTNGAMHFHRADLRQAVVFQSTFARIPASVSLEAEFEVANTSSVRKRISVLVHDADFTDLSVCTFWLPANAPSRVYRMRTHTTEAWTNATLSFYAASIGSNGGSYVLDTVSLRAIPAVPVDRTDCVDPLAPAAVGGAPGANLLVNGDFTAGLPPWSLFGLIVSQVAAGVFEFYRPAGTGPAGVVFQPTNTALPANQIVTATFNLGNTSGVRKRVTVLLHDLDFSDLHACTFWLPPGLPLSPYTMRSYASEAWTNATLSVYASTVGVEQWTRLDDVTFQQTPAAAIFGTECLEPGASALVPFALSPVAASRAFLIDADDTLQLARPIDLTDTRHPRLTFASWLPSPATGLVQISLDGVDWTTVAVITSSDSWTTAEIDLTEFAGKVVHVRFVYQQDVRSGVRPLPWHVGGVDIRRDQRR